MAQEQGVDIADVAESGTMVLVAVMVGTAIQCVSKVRQAKSSQNLKEKKIKNKRYFSKQSKDLFQWAVQLEMHFLKMCWNTIQTLNAQD